MEIGLVEIDVVLEEGEEGRVAVCEVDTSGLSVGGVVESHCEREASKQVSAPRTPSRVIYSCKNAQGTYIPHEAAAGAELNSVRCVPSAGVYERDPHCGRCDGQ